MAIYSSNNFLKKAQKKYRRGKTEGRYFTKFFNPYNSESINGKKVLIYSGIGNMFITPIEILMYHSLKQRGCEVDYFIYDKSIPINEIITKAVVEKQGKDNFWNNSVEDAEQILKGAKVDFSWISPKADVKQLFNSITDFTELENFEYEGINFGRIASGVMYRYYESISFGRDKMDIMKQFLFTSLTNYFQIKEAHEKNSYDLVLFSHGIYCTWEPVLEFCKANRVPFVTYDRGKKLGTCNFNFNQPSPDWSFDDYWKRCAGFPLDSNEIADVNHSLADRELQKGDVFAYNTAPKTNNLHQLRADLNIPSECKVITFFTNLIWDAANVLGETAFSSPFEALVETVEKYRDRDDIHIVLRPHPAEFVIGSKERYGQLLRDQYNPLPKNVTIIEPEMEINSFSVLDLTDIGVVHTSTVGLEIAMQGKPVLLISDTHYRGKGFTRDVESKAHFFEQLESLFQDHSELPNQVELAYKYFYLMMFKYQHTVPMTFDENKLFDGFGYASFQELVEDKKLLFNRIVDRMINPGESKDFVFWERFDNQK